MTSKLVVNTIEADTGISSVSFASSISLSSTSVFHLGDAGFNIGADTNINRAGNGVLGFNINGSEKVRINSSGRVGIGTNNPQAMLEVQDRSDGTLIGLSVGTQYGNAGFGGYNNYPAILNNNASGEQPLIYCDTNNDRTIFFGDTVGFGTTCAFRVNGAERARITASGLNVTGVGTFSGGVTVGYDSQYSPIQQSANTWWYTRLDQIASYQSSNLQNLATSSIKVNEVIPIHYMTRQSDAGAHSIYNGSTTSGQVKTNMSAANPFAPKSYGLTMGTLFYPHTSGNNGSGVIHYGGNASTQHFYVRYKYSGDSILIGEDTGSSDVWTVAYQNDVMSDSNWYFFVVAIERNGTLLVSLNGAPLTPIRLSGTAPAPTDAFFGLAGDPYGDNNSRHRYATAFWHRGVMSNELIAQEYAWLKTIWTGASLP